MWHHFCKVPKQKVTSFRRYDIKIWISLSNPVVSTPKLPNRRLPKRRDFKSSNKFVKFRKRSFVTLYVRKFQRNIDWILHILFVQNSLSAFLFNMIFIQSQRIKIPWFCKFRPNLMCRINVALRLIIFIQFSHRFAVIRVIITMSTATFIWLHYFFLTATCIRAALRSFGSLE